MKFLLAKLNHLGDTLVLTPTIRFLRERYPDARIDVLVRSGCEVMLRNNPDISNIIAVARPEKSKRSLLTGLSEFLSAYRQVAFQRYDYAFDLSDSDRAKFWIALSRAKVRGVNVAYTRTWKHNLLFNRLSEYPWADLHQVEKDLRTVLDTMELSGEAGRLRFSPATDRSRLGEKLPWLEQLENFVVIHPTSRWAYKQWLPERWALVADHLKREYGVAVIFSTGPDVRESDYVAAVLSKCQEKHFATAGKTTLHELGWLLGKCRLFMGVDTVAMHLAAAMQAPTIALFGPSSEWSWHPWNTQHEIVSGNCPCKTPPRAFVCDTTKPLPCVESISTEMVLRALRRLEARGCQIVA